MHPALRRALIPLLVGLPTAAGAAPLTADDVVRTALLRHPDAVAAEGAVTSAEGARREVGTFLANPQAEAGIAVVGGLVQGSVTQPISLAGEGWFARSSAAAGIDAATFARSRARLVVARDARAAWARAVTAQDAAELAEEGLRQATHLREAAEARAALGEASMLDVRLARLAEAEAAGHAIAARRSRSDAQIALSAFAPDGATADLADDPMSAVPAPSAPADRTDRLSAEAEVLQAERELARARAAVLPLVGIGAFYQRDDAHGDPGDVGPQISVGIPLWARNQAATSAARAERDTARARLAALEARIETERETTTDAAGFAVEAIGRIGDFEADARAALDSIELGWSSGELILADAVQLRRQVLDGWTAALEARLSAVEARLDALLATDDPALLPTSESAP